MALKEQTPRAQERGRKSRLSPAVLFTGVALLVGIVVIGLALALGQDVGKVSIGPDGTSVEFVKSAAAGEKLSAEDVEAGDLEARVADLEAEAETNTDPGTTEGWEYFPMTGSNGLTYEFAQYGDQVVFQEVSSYGVTAVGSGTVTDSQINGSFQAVNGSTGSVQLTIREDGTLEGQFVNGAYGAVPITMW